MHRENRENNQTPSHGAATRERDTSEGSMKDIHSNSQPMCSKNGVDHRARDIMSHEGLNLAEGMAVTFPVLFPSRASRAARVSMAASLAISISEIGASPEGGGAGAPVPWRDIVTAWRRHLR